ncbi:MAG: DUF1365 domain-containing protein [Betaproteobacteria bacterium]|nr:DUF1365 domain-containing protein [Betaproteobacteria bacterium]
MNQTLAPFAMPMLGVGQVRHTRLRPRRHAFAYPTWFLMLPMRQMAIRGAGDLPLNRPGWVSFHDQDHGDGRGPESGGALAWLDELLAAQGVDDAQGEVWLHTYARVLGYVFKPVSFWYCHRADNSLAAIVAEVNNTFGERHCYVLHAPRYGQTLQAQKVFYVSPFCEVRGDYAFRFMRTQSDQGERTVVRIDHSDAQGLLISTSVSGRLQTLNACALRRVWWANPMHSLGVIARIHWQALWLWLKHIPLVTKPSPPKDFASRGYP